MSGDDRPDDGSDGAETPPDVLTPEELSPDDVRRLDETTRVIPLSDTETTGEPVSGAGEIPDDSRTTNTEPDPEGFAFSADTQVRTPAGGVAFEAGSDDLAEFFDEFMIQLLRALAPDRDPETALAVLLHSSSLSVTVNPDGEA